MECSITDFYRGQSIFITGVTGFLGKVLLEKLLRSCPKIEHIYVLMRAKKNQDINERLNKIIRIPLFEKLRLEQPEFHNKVTPINGDMKADELGISKEDQQIIIENVSVVFHSAADVRFDIKIREAVDINVKGTQRLLDFCRRIIDLKALVYVSTAYSNCTRNEIDETFYDPPYDPEAFINFTENFSDDFIDKNEKLLLGQYTNIYVLTKALTEDVVRKNTDLPIIVVRPSIIMCTNSEPISGWNDSFFGTTSLVMAIAAGIVRTAYVKKEKIADFIPVDMVVSVMIAAAWKMGTTRLTDKTIYNVTSGSINPITWAVFIENGTKFIRKYPTARTIWYPGVYITSTKTVYNITGFFLHYLPSFIFDFLLYLTGRKPMFRKAYEIISRNLKVFEWILTNEWKFSSKNVDNLYNSMSVEDQKLFAFDVSQINRTKYVENNILGIRRFMFKESDSTIENCRKKLFWLKITHIFTKIVLIISVISYLLLFIFYFIY